MGVSSFLKNEEFTLIAEIDPPKGVDLTEFIDSANAIRGRVNAVMVTDGGSAVMRMTPLAPCRELIEHNIEPIMILNGRDRNRISFQGDLLGAWRLGVRNILLEQGHEPSTGDQPMALRSKDLTPEIALQCVKALNNGRDLGGDDLMGATGYAIGVRIEASDDVNKNRKQAQAIMELPKDVVSYLVLGPTYDANIVDLFAKSAFDAGIRLFTSVMLLKSVAMIRYLNDLPGAPSIPNEFLKKMMSSPVKHKAGMEIAAEFIEDIKDRCKGAVLVTLGWGNNMPEFLSMLGR